MNNNTLQGRVAMTPAERIAGRFMRAPDGHEAGPSLETPPNNGGQAEGGNSGSPMSGESDPNNTGNAFDPDAFWNGSAPSGQSAPSGESAVRGQGESGANGDSGEGNRSGFAQQLQEQLNGLKFGDPIFDDQIAGEINEGNYSGVQQRLEAMGQQVVRQALAMQVQILRPFAEQLMEQVRNENKQTFEQRDNTESLERLFPAAKNPAMARMIQPIYDQALKNAGGDREKAVEQTKEMLRFAAGTSAGDLNLEIAPKGQGDRGSPTPDYNWLDDLTGRK